MSELRQRSLPRLLAGGWCLLLVLGVLGCGTGSRSLFGGDAAVRLQADPGINQDSPVALELVVVYDKDLLEKLAAMTAGDWFKNRDQIQKDYPGDDHFVSMRWEVVPGQSLDEQSLSFGSGARGGIVFADYFSAGAHRTRVDPHQNLRIHLQADDFVVEATP